MNLLKEQKKRISELYSPEDSNGMKAFEKFHGEYREVSREVFFGYWRICRYHCTRPIPIFTKTPVKKTPDARYRDCIDPDRI